MPVLGSKPPYLFDHSTDPNKRCCHAHPAVPNGHGALHRPVPGILCAYDPTGTRRRPHQTRSSSLRNVTAGSTRQLEGHGRSYVKSRRSRPGQGQRFKPRAFGLAIARSLSASDILFSDGLTGRFFSFLRLLFGEVSSVPQKVRNIDSSVGFHFAVAIIFQCTRPTPSSSVRLR